MIEVEAPDGSIVEFPDGTPRDVMAKAMRAKFGGAPVEPQSMGQRIQSGASNAFRAADDVARLVASGATLGFADKFAGFMGGEGAEAERVKTQAARERAGTIPAIAAEVAGAVAPAGLVARGVGAAASMAPRALASVVGNPFAQAGATGAALGAGAALGNDTPVATGAAIGAGAGVLGQGAANAIASGVGRVAGMFNRKPNIPTPDAIRAAKGAAYQEAESAGVVFTPNLFQRVRSEIEPKLAQMGYDPALQPNIAAVIRRIDDAGQASNTLPGAEIVRRVAGGAYAPGNKSSNDMMRAIINAIDDAVANPRAGEVLMGNAAKGGAALTEARKNASIEFKLGDINKQLEKAQTQAGSTWSGGNIENATRQKLRAILDNPSRSRGFTPDERAALQQAVMGSGAGHNLARTVGKLSPQGSGLMTALGIGGAVTNPALVAAPIAGAAAKKVSERLTDANVRKLLDIVAAGGSRAATEAAPNAVQRLTQAERERLARLLMAFGVSSGVPALSQQ